tara:strand:- start:121 stop:906 length:786 start_codon:yes stop_codon:yes gene_type:complete
MTDLDENDLNEYAKKLLDDYDAVTPGTIFKEKINISVAQALDLQSKVALLRENRGDEIVGYKIGCTSKSGNQHIIGLSHPAWGRLWKNEQYKNGSTLIKKNYFNPSMEAEFGIILNRDIKKNNFSFEYLFSSVETVHPIIEIHNLLFHGKHPHGAELLANNALHAGVVRGKGIKNLTLDQQTDLKLIYNGKIVDSWTKKKWSQDMFSDIEWLLNELHKINKYLKKGDLILTGAFGPPIPIDINEDIEVTSSLIGNVSAKFI